MSSSTSSSEAAIWRRFTARLIAVAALLLAAVLGLAYLVDPYDTGRSPVFEKAGVRPQGPRTAAASRGRDPAFRAAIVGNSHTQLLSPERLRERTGIPFVQLAVPATGPKEQLVLVDWFVRHRETPPEAVVLGADTTWCTADPALANDKPFPFWLFSESPLDYVQGLLRFDILEELPRRIGYLAARNPERARPDGYWDYEADYMALGFGIDPNLKARLDQPAGGRANHTGRFPAAAALADLARSLPPETSLVVLIPPHYITAQPASGSRDAASEEACKAALRQAVAGRPKSAVVDWRVDRPENRDPSLFFDHTHYRQGIAQAVEADIAAALRSFR